MLSGLLAAGWSYKDYYLQKTRILHDFDMAVAVDFTLPLQTDMLQLSSATVTPVSETWAVLTKTLTAFR